MRLTADVDAWARERAEVKVLSPGAYVASLVTAAKRAHEGRTEPAAPSTTTDRSSRRPKRFCEGPHDLWFDTATVFTRCKRCDYLRQGR